MEHATSNANDDGAHCRLPRKCIGTWAMYERKGANGGGVRLTEKEERPERKKKGTQGNVTTATVYGTLKLMHDYNKLL